MELIASGADVNSRTHYNMTPLHLACSFGPREMVSMLIAAGSRASVDVKNTQGRTLMHYASQKGNIGAVRLLLEAGATQTYAQIMALGLKTSPTRPKSG